MNIMNIMNEQVYTISVQFILPPHSDFYSSGHYFNKKFNKI